jgi:hypothetical protein
MKVSSGRNEIRDSLSAKIVNEKRMEKNGIQKSGFMVREFRRLV